MAELPEGWVRIEHPDLDTDQSGEPHACPREAFDEVWSKKGFVIVEEASADTVDYNSLKVDELKALVQERGIEVDGSARKAELVTALEQHDGQTAGSAEEA